MPQLGAYEGNPIDEALMAIKAESRFKGTVVDYTFGNGQRPGLNVMALLTVNTESALTEAGNYVLTASVFHGYFWLLRMRPLLN